MNRVNIIVRSCWGSYPSLTVTPVDVDMDVEEFKAIIARNDAIMQEDWGNENHYFTRPFYCDQGARNSISIMQAFEDVCPDVTFVKHPYIHIDDMIIPMEYAKSCVDLGYDQRARKLAARKGFKI